MNKKHIEITILIAILTSCVTNKELTYLQYDGAVPDTVVSVTPSAYRIMPFDNLYIRVITPDPRWSAMFNMLPVTTSSFSISEQSAELISYAVDSTGAIKIPYAGRIQVAGKTLQTITAEVEIALQEYISDAAVSVKLVNNYVSLIGEVNSPGRYPIYKERMNIFQALAMGTDLGDFSNRQEIQIIRQTAHGNVVKKFTLTDRSILSSEFFYVMPNDVIYAKPSKGRFWQLNTFPYGLIISTLTLFVLIYNVIR